VTPALHWEITLHFYAVPSIGQFAADYKKWRPGATDDEVKQEYEAYLDRVAPRPDAVAALNFPARAFSESPTPSIQDPLLLPRATLCAKVIAAVDAAGVGVGVVRIIASPGSGKSWLISLVCQKLQGQRRHSLHISCLDLTPPNPVGLLIGPRRSPFGLLIDHLGVHDPSIFVPDDLNSTKRVIFLDDAHPLFEVKGLIDHLVKTYYHVTFVVVTSFACELMPDVASPYNVAKVFPLGGRVVVDISMSLLAAYFGMACGGFGF